MEAPIQRRGLLIALVVIGVLDAAAVAFVAFWPRSRPEPNGVLVLARVREVARLEALEVNLYRKISFSPEPQPTGSVWGDVWSWARHTLNHPQGRAIVFARAHLSYDLARLQPSQLRQTHARAELVLPPLEVVVELLPDETEVLGSNLDSAETAQLLGLARGAFEREVQSDAQLRARAEASAQATLRALLFDLGYHEVRVLPQP